MAERLLEAWETVENDATGVVKITPFGEPFTGEADEQLIPDDSHERVVYARRIVAQRCLYGVDINPLATEMAKLSLWLLTLAKDKPFTFLDHSIRSGDSLVGITSVNQLERFSLNGGGPQKSFAQEQIRRRIDAAKLLRKQLERMPTNTVEDSERKAEMLRRAQEQTDRLRYAADMMLAVHWKSLPDAQREQELQDTLRDVEFKFKDLPIPELRREASSKLQSVGCPRTFHWALEYPEVFDAGGVDAFVCNPPFMGGTKLEPAFGRNYREYLVNSIAGGIRGVRGTADLCCYFLRRSAELAKDSGHT
ncbi:MAG: Eco57I restriction-modification methylase domain-containing protein, partial [Planctomycetales bacterium]